MYTTFLKNLIEEYLQNIDCLIEDKTPSNGLFLFKAFTKYST